MLRKIARHKLIRHRDAVQNHRAHVVTVPPHIFLGRARTIRAAKEIDLCVSQCDANVVEFRLESLEPGRLRRGGQVRVCLFRQNKEVFGMALAELGVGQPEQPAPLLP